MPGYLDRRRAAMLMREAGLDALVLAQPETITYAAGAFPGVATFWRRAGAAFVVVPADNNAPLAAIVGDLQVRSFVAQSGIADVRSHQIWVETDSWPLDPRKPARSPRPAQYEPSAVIALLQDVLAERGLVGGRIGLELGFIPAADFPLFSTVPVRWQDCTRVVERLRAVKSPPEIAFLRSAALCSAAGLRHLAGAIEPGMDASGMTEIWKSAAIAEAALMGETALQSTWAYIAVGGDGFAPGGPARPGDIIKIDVGCVVSGYSSDGARTAVLGSPSADAQRVYDALRRAFDAGFGLLGPGVPVSEVYCATAAAMWEQGYATYGRGHFGHGVGASIWSEEWPFISVDCDAVLEPGMVMAFETPWYIDGLGGFIIEDQVIITDAGCEVMAPLPRELVRA